MSWFRRPKDEATTAVTSPAGSLDRWEIVVRPKVGVEYALSGYVSSVVDQDEAEVLRYVDALADGLRRAGYDPEVTLTHTESSKRLAQR